jgi:hypothetical protein
MEAATHQRQPPHLWQGRNLVRLSIPIHGNRALKVGLLRHLAKIAEIPDEDLD